MKNEDWLKDIHDRMADHEIDEPHGLWEDIQAAEAKAAPMVAMPRRGKLWPWLTASAAAASALLIGGLELLAPTDGTQPSQPGVEPVVAELTDPEDVMHDEADGGEAEQTVAPQPSVLPKPRRQLVQTQVPEDAVLAETTLAEPQFAAEEEQPRADAVMDVHELLGQELTAIGQAPLTEKSQRYPSQPQPRRKVATTEQRLAFGLSSSGSLNADSRELFLADNDVTSASLNGASWMDSPLLGLMSLTRGMTTSRQASHHTPLKACLSVSYRLNDRWSLDTGIGYSHLASSFQEGSTDYFINEKQTLHYVGVPLGATYRALSWRRVDLYLSGRVMAEQCVSGQNQMSYIIDDEVVDLRTQTVESRPLQWSAGAMLGVQYNLTNLLSLYLEPGCNYYLDDHSSLETIYKDHPLEFNMTVGARIRIGY